jgi:hypothetical protein
MNVLLQRPEAKIYYHNPNKNLLQTIFQVLTDTRTHETRGSAFVRFDRREEAEKAIEALDGFMVSGSFQPLVS